jgi:hypothetical protein
MQLLNRALLESFVTILKKRVGQKASELNLSVFLPVVTFPKQLLGQRHFLLTSIGQGFVQTKHHRNDLYGLMPPARNRGTPEEHGAPGE